MESKYNTISPEVLDIVAKKKKWPFKIALPALYILIMLGMIILNLMFAKHVDGIGNIYVPALLVGGVISIPGIIVLFLISALVSAANSSVIIASAAITISVLTNVAFYTCIGIFIDKLRNK